MHIMDSKTILDFEEWTNFINIFYTVISDGWTVYIDREIAF